MRGLVLELQVVFLECDEEGLQGGLQGLRDADQAGQQVPAGEFVLADLALAVLLPVLDAFGDILQLINQGADNLQVQGPLQLLLDYLVVVPLRARYVLTRFGFYFPGK